MGAALSRLWKVLFNSRLQPCLFVHDSILDEDSVRLLRFVRPKWYTFGLSKPRLCIETYSIKELPKYVALSYTWGPPQDGIATDRYHEKLSVLVNEQPFPIFRNLVDALYCLQWRWNFDDDIQHLWIDAICINQENLAERAAQVGIMDKVYKGASSTVIWLGTGTSETRRALRMFKTLLMIPPEDFAPYYQQYPNGTPPPDEFWHARGLPSVEREEEWKPLIQFFEHCWFSRAWIIQEITLSCNNVYLFWGDISMTWDELGHLALAGRAARLGQLGTLPALSRYLSAETGPDVQDWVVRDPLVNSFQLWYNRHRYIQRSQGPVEDTLLTEMKALTGCAEATASSWLMYFSLTNRWADATDPRDKVFGHLGLVNNIADQDGICPAEVHAMYSANISASQVYEQTMRLLIEETDSLAVLMAINDPPCSRLDDLPSWVPDLSRRQGLDLMWSIRPQFKAAGIDEQYDHGPEFAESRKIRVDGPYLHVKGAIIGTVMKLSVSLSDLIGSNWHCWASHLLALDVVYPFTKESRVEAFWRTLLMNSVARKCPAQWQGSQNGEMFRAYVLQCLARYFPGPNPESESYKTYLSQLQDVNELSKTDFSNHMPSFTGMKGLISQITNVEEETFSVLSDQTILEALTSCVDRASTFLIGMDGCIVNRRIVTSDQGHLANSPMWTEAGDVIVILQSCPCPVVLRPHPEEPSRYLLVGTAYVHGVMHGESINENTEWKNICIR